LLLLLFCTTIILFRSRDHRSPLVFDFIHNGFPYTLAFILLFNIFENFSWITLKFSSASSSNNVHSAGEKFDFRGRLITLVDADMVRNFLTTFLKRFMKTYLSFCIATHSNKLRMDSYPTDRYPPCYSCVVQHIFIQRITIHWIGDLSGG
jgi:hypothetical protein